MPRRNDLESKLTTIGKHAGDVRRVLDRVAGKMPDPDDLDNLGEFMRPGELRRVLNACGKIIAEVDAPLPSEAEATATRAARRKARGKKKTTKKKTGGG